MIPCVVVRASSVPASREALEGLRAHGPVLVAGAVEAPGLDGVEALGPGADVRAAWDRARALGCTHAVVGGRAESPEVVARLVHQAAQRPEAFLVARRAEGAARGPGRLARSLAVWAASGVRLHDPRPGPRVYPLERLGELGLRRRGARAELEALVAAAWVGTEVAEVGAPAGPAARPSLGSRLLAAALLAQLLVLRVCLPPVYLRLRSLASFRQRPARERWRLTARVLVVDDAGSPGRVAGSVGLGLFMGLSPFWGLQIALALLLAHLLSLSKPVAVLATHVSLPVTLPAIVWAQLALGRLALSTPASPALSALEAYGWPYVVGSLVLAALASTAGAATTFAVLSLAERLRRKPAA